MYKGFRWVGASLMLAGMANTSAAELGVMGGVGIQYKQLNMEQKFSDIDTSAMTTNGSGELSAVLPVLALQGIVFYDSFYAALKIEKGLTSDSVDSDVPFTTENTNLSTDVSRKDASLVFGYKAWQDLSVFAGYMHGKTELEPEAGSCADNNNQFNCNLAAFMSENVGGKYRQEYSETGFFFGVGYGWEFDSGRLNTSLAYALMDGGYSDNYRERDESQNVVAEDFKYEGDSKGLSLALTWVAPITERVSYFVDGRIQRYSMDASDKSQNQKYVNSKVETDETMVGLAGGVQMFY